MGDWRSNEDGVHNISTSIFVTNFPDQTNAKELWKLCTQFGNVIDAFIPNRRSKAVKTRVHSQSDVKVSKPALVLDDSCFYESDLTLSLVGKLKEFGSLQNLKNILVEEGFTDIIIRYMGGWAPNFTDDDASDDASDEESADSKFDDFQKEVNLEKESESVEIPETLFEEPEHVEMKSSAFKEVHKKDSKEEKSEDPFNIYAMLNKKKPGNSATQQSEGKGADSTAIYTENVNTSGCSGYFKSVSTPKTGGSMLHLIEDLIKVGQAMGYKMEGEFYGSDYFIAIMGKWLPNNKKLLIISVYAPQELAEKKMLWQYLNLVIDIWKGDVIVMGDFNEVRSEDERYGSVFNARGADAFNSFISTGGLISCPDLSSLILDRYLSDHGPILLRELSLDYGPTPFRFFHNWFDLEGFEAFITDTWRSINIIKSNVMLKMAKKLKLLKGHIRVWVKGKQFSVLNLKNDLRNKLSAIDSSIDKGKTSSVSLEERMAIMNNLISLEKMESSELAQKAKVKWLIEDRLILNMDFPNRLSLDQAQDLERSFSKEEIKEAVWGCGLDKSPGPDGFTFGFYRRFWSFIEGEVVEAVNPFFNNGFCHKGGLRINLHKRKLMGIAVENSLVDFAANKIGCMTLNIPFSYLGVNIGGHMSRIKLTLLKSVLGSTPIYYVSMFKAPIHVINKLEAIRSHFFNGVDTNIRKMTFAKWDNVLASKEKSGLGVSSFYALNRALILSGFGDSIPKGIDLLGAIKKKVGNGENTLFWQEPWKGDAPFKNVFPTLYALESDKRITMAEKMTHPSLGTSFRHNPRCGIEQVQMVSLLSQLEGLILPNISDRWSWSLFGDGEFFVSSTSNLIDDKTLETVGSKIQWCKYVSLKVNIFS
ncbi:RNA-directed DNA polymerase, eukaryota, reverse transcriptase zinc-binding domain protein [Tanacetum coccineum]